MKVTGYELSRDWFDFSFENPELINPNHSALFFFAIEHCNRLGWKSKFGLPSGMAMEAIGIKSYKTYRKTLSDLINWGFVEMIQKSKNQYSSVVIALVKNTKATTKALDNAMIKHGTKQLPKHTPKHSLYNKTNNNITKERGPLSFSKPTIEEIKQYCTSRKNNVDPVNFWNFYEAKGWMVGKNNMKDWQAAVRTWESRVSTTSNEPAKKLKYE